MSLLSKIDAQMNSILTLIKKTPKFNNSMRKKMIDMKKERSSCFLILSTNNNQEIDRSNSSSFVLQDNQSNNITSQNFPLSHICNRDVD
jgi:hypothetical protein